MTVWEKVIVNMEKAGEKITAGAALFSERVRAEIAIVRLRIKLDELRSLINEQYGVIGRKIVELEKKDALPRTTDQLVNEEDIAAALSEIAAREKDLRELYHEIENEQSAFKPAEKNKEDTPA